MELNCILGRGDVRSHLNEGSFASSTPVISDHVEVVDPKGITRDVAGGKLSGNGQTIGGFKPDRPGTGKLPV